MNGVKILHKSSFSKSFSWGKFLPKVPSIVCFSCAAVLFNKQTFIQSKYCKGEILWSFLHSWRNIIPCREMWLLQTLYNMIREMWLLQTLYNMIKVTHFLKNLHILWKFHDRVTFPSVTIWSNEALLKLSTDFCHFHHIWHSVTRHI